MTMPAQFPALQQRGLAKFIKLALDFSANEVLDPRITFSRTSNATRVNAQGLVEYAPHNLLTYSENFDNAVWVKSNATVTANAVVAPDGTTTADKLVEDTANSQHYTNTYTATIGVTYSISFYAKKGGRSKLLVSGFGLLGQGYNPLFDLEALTVSSAPSNATIQDVGNGWRRCSLTVTATGSSGLFIYLYTNSNSYTGDGTSGIYIWGAQLNIGSLQPYYTTSVKNLLGYSQNFENAAWTKSNSSVLTNLLTYSQEFDNAVWIKTTATLTANVATAPDGTTTADNLTATGVDSAVRQQNISATAGQSYVFSVYLRADTPTTLSIFIIDAGGGAGNTQQVVNVTTSWQRFTVTRTLSAGTTVISAQIGGANTFSTGESVYCWGAQLVQGTNPEEYTVTTSAPAPIQVMGPLGFLGAEKLVENTVNTGHYIGPVGGGLSLVAGQTVTYSVYAKAGERTFVQLIQTGIGPAGANLIAGFDLTNGIAGTPNAGSSSIQNIGSGWYRCSFTTFVSTAATSTLQIRLALNTTAFPSSYTGDGISGIYIFGAQLSDSASLDPYSYNFGAAPTSSAYYGPRFDYDPVTLAPRGLLIEEQRINILLNSDTLSTQSVSVTAQAYTLSFYGTGSVALSGAYTGSLVGTGVYPNRVQLTFTPAIGTLTLTVTGSVRYANLEAGAFPTSYIPTTSASVTRAADNASMVGTNFSSWYNQSEGTIYSQWMLGGDNISNSVYSISDGSASNLMRSRYNSAGTGIDNAVITSGATVAVLNATNQITTYSGYKNAMAYLVNDFARAANTVLVTDNSGAIPIVNQINIGASVGAVEQLNGHIKSFKFFSKRFINTYLQSLTQ